MNLHTYYDEFEGIILQVGSRVDIRSDVLEKDYYVTLMLKELAANQDTWKAYFKGGTALYKALGSMNRFSEDIDLTVSIEGCTSNTSKKNRIVKSAKGYTCLERMKDDPDHSNSRDSITAIYKYDPIFVDDLGDSLQRFGRVKVESTSFTVSEPIESLKIAPIIYTMATGAEKEILENSFEVKPFDVLTIKLERIFIDKMFAVEFYYKRYKQNINNVQKRDTFGFDVAKHIYDLMIMHKLDKIKKFQANLHEVEKIISLKRVEEALRFGGIDESLNVRDFSYLFELDSDSKFADHYNRMQEIYVFNESDKVALSEATDVIDYIRTIRW